MTTEIYYKIKEKIKKVSNICSLCNVVCDKGLCRDIHLSQKLNIGCGLWKENGKPILDNESYEIINKLSALCRVINDIRELEVSIR